MEEPVIKSLVQRVKELQDGDTPITLLAVCPNSDAVLEAAIEVAARTGRRCCSPPPLIRWTVTADTLDGPPRSTSPAWANSPRNTGARAPLSLPRPRRSLAQGCPCPSQTWTCRDHGRSEALYHRLLGGRLLAAPRRPHRRPRSLWGEPLDVRIVVKRTVELMEHAEPSASAWASDRSPTRWARRRWPVGSRTWRASRVS